MKRATKLRLRSEGLPAELLGATRVAIDDAGPGQYVALVGIIVSEPLLVAPMSGRACVAFDLVITTAQPVPTVHRRALAAKPFTIETEDGTAEIDPRGAYVRLVYDEVTYLLNRTHMTAPEALDGLEDVGPISGWEGALERNQRVLAIGVVQRDVSDETVYRRSSDVAIRIAGGPRHPAMIGDRLDDLEWIEREGGQREPTSIE